MATPYIKHDGVNYKIQAGLPTGGVDTLQFTDSASSFTQTVPAATGTLALTTIATGTNAIVTTDMAAGFRALDGLVMPNVLGYLTNTPPGSPANGDCYIIGAAPTGAWAGQGGKVARYSTVAAAWEFFTPKNGWMLEANSTRETYRYTGSAWEIFYQEGTWTPVIYGSGGSAGSYLASAAVGLFTKIGRSVFAQMYLNLGNKGSWTGATRISGLPFTANATTNAYGGASVGFASNITFTAGYTMMAAYVNTGASTMDLVLTGSGVAASGLDYSLLATSLVAISITATYFT